MSETRKIAAILVSDVVGGPEPALGDAAQPVSEVVGRHGRRGDSGGL